MMLRPSKKLALAVEAVVDIGLHAGKSPVQSQEIGERLGLPRRYLEHVMQHLVRAGILRGVRGPRGGYRLAREQRRVTVGDIFRIVQGIERDAEDGLAEPQSKLADRVMAPFWLEIEREIVERLDGVTIEDLCRRAKEAGVTVAMSEHADFNI